MLLLDLLGSLYSGYCLQEQSNSINIKKTLLSEGGKVTGLRLQEFIVSSDTQYALGFECCRPLAPFVCPHRHFDLPRQVMIRDVLTASPSTVLTSKSRTHFLDILRILAPSSTTPLPSPFPTSPTNSSNLSVIATMSFSRGASRLLQAAKFTIAWPIRVKVEPFSAPDARMEKILATRQPDPAAGIAVHFIGDDHHDINNFSLRWRVRFGDFGNAFEGSGTYLLGCKILSGRQNFSANSTSLIHKFARLTKFY